MKEKISGTQFSMLMFLMITATAILFVPAITAQQSRQSAWIVPLVLPTVAGCVAAGEACILGQRFPGLTLVQYSEVILGKPLGKVFSSSYILFLLILNILVIRELSEFLTIVLLPASPAYILILVTVLLGLFLALKGIEVIARMVQFVLPLFVLTFIFMISLALIDFEFGNLLPLLEGGVMTIVKGSVVPASWYGEIGVITLLLPMINKPQEARSKAVKALLCVAVFLTVDVLVTVAVFGPDLTGVYMFPFWSLAGFVQISRYIERVESFIVLLWLTAIILKITLFFYLSSFATAQLFKLKSYQTAVYPLALLHGIFAIFPALGSIELSEILKRYWPPLGLMFELAIPFLLLVIAIIRKKSLRGGKQ